jgi:hypothetical protein
MAYSITASNQSSKLIISKMCLHSKKHSSQVLHAQHSNLNLNAV